MSPEDRPTAVVVGGGITGLAAAWQLARAPGAPSVVVLEADDRLGGKILTGAPPVEYGPDAFLARVPHATELCRELGLADELVPPATGQAWLWWRNRLRRLPAGLVLGVPSDLTAVARSGIIGPSGLARAALDLVLPRTGGEGDRSVGEIVAARFGRQVQSRLVDPLLGGINAGRSELLSARATAPQLDAAARSSRSLLLGLRRQGAAATASGPGADGPVFLTHPRGLGHVVETLAGALRERGVEIRTRTAARRLTGGAGGWTLDAGGEEIRAHSVIICTPAPAAAGLLGGPAPEAARALGAIEHASVVVVTFGFSRSALAEPFPGSGFLVPRPDGRLLTAATFMTSKWAHVGQAHPGRLVVRVSAGRHHDERAWRLGDDELAAALAEELAEATGLAGPPEEVTVTRWGGAFPQYTVGHLDRVAAIEAALERTPGLAVAGAAMRGVGIPACIAQGRQAADRALARLRAGRAA